MLAGSSGVRKLAGGVEIEVASESDDKLCVCVARSAQNEEKKGKAVQAQKAGHFEYLSKVKTMHNPNLVPGSSRREMEFELRSESFCPT